MNKYETLNRRRTKQRVKTAKKAGAGQLPFNDKELSLKLTQILEKEKSDAGRSADVKLRAVAKLLNTTDVEGPVLRKDKDVIRWARSVRHRQTLPSSNSMRGLPRSSATREALVPAIDREPFNYGLDSQSNINIIVVNDESYEMLFPYGTSPSKTVVGWTGGGTRRLPSVGTAILPLACSHRGDTHVCYIPVENCYPASGDDFGESIISYQSLLDGDKCHSAHMTATAKGHHQHLQLRDCNGQARKIEVKIVGGRWWLPGVVPEESDAMHINLKCSSTSRAMNSIEPSYTLQERQQLLIDHELVDTIGGKSRLWTTPCEIPETPTPTSAAEELRVARKLRTVPRAAPRFESNDKEGPTSKKRREHGETQRETHAFVVEEEMDESEEGGDDETKEVEPTLPTWSTEDSQAARRPPRIAAKSRAATLEDVSAAVIKIVSDMAAGAVKKGDADTRARSKGPANVTGQVHKRTRTQGHGLLCHASMEQVERSVPQWSNTLLSGIRPHPRECSCCNYTNSRLGARLKVNARDDAAPKVYGETVQIDLQNWDSGDSSLGGHRSILRGIESRWGEAYASYHKTKGGSDMLVGIEEILDKFEANGAFPKRIICDVEAAFVTDEFKDLLKTRDIELIPHAARSPWETGLVERLNKTINEMRAACLFMSKGGAAFRMMADRHCMNVRNDFLVSGRSPSPPSTCATGRARSPRLLHTWFADVWCLDTARLKKGSLVKDDSARLRGYYVGYDKYSILVWDPLHGRIIRVGRRQYIINERWEAREEPPLDCVIFEDNPAGFQPPNYNAKGATVSAWANGKIPWASIDAEEKRRLTTKVKRAIHTGADVKATGKQKAQAKTIIAVNAHLIARGKKLAAAELRKAAADVDRCKNPKSAKPGARRLKRERFPDHKTDEPSSSGKSSSGAKDNGARKAGRDEDQEEKSESKRPPPCSEGELRKVSVAKEVIGQQVSVYYEHDGDCENPGWHHGTVRRAWANAVPEVLYQVKFADGDQEDFNLEEVHYAMEMYAAGHRTRAKEKAPPRKKQQGSKGKEKKPSPNARRSKRINATNAIHFDFDIFQSSNEEEWEAMETVATLRNALGSATASRSRDRPKFTSVQHQNAMKSKKARKRLNAIIANPDMPSARTALDQDAEDYHFWEASTLSEVGGVMRQALDAIPVDELTPEERRSAMRSKLVCKVKRDAHGNIIKRKVRLVAGGDSSILGKHHDWTHAPTANPTSMRTLIALGTRLRKIIRHFDLTQCYLQAPINQPCLLKTGARLLMWPPKELIVKDKWGRACIFQVTSNLYGLASGGADSFTHVDNHLLKDQKLMASRGDPCLYAKKSEGWNPQTKGTGKPGEFLYLSLYTDDGIYYGDKKSEAEFEKKLQGHLKVGSLTPCEFVLGMRVEQLLYDEKNKCERDLGEIENKTKISQRAFAVEILRLTPEAEWLHESDKTNGPETGAPTTAPGELPDFNAKTVLPDGAPRQLTPMSTINSKILDESFAAAVQQLQEEKVLSKPLYLEDAGITIGGGGTQEPPNASHSGHGDGRSSSSRPFSKSSKSGERKGRGGRCTVKSRSITIKTDERRRGAGIRTASS